MPTHAWHLSITDEAKKQIDKLPAKDRMAIFRAMAALLQADNPTSVSDVRPLVEKRFEGQYRLRQGDYRIFFSISSDGVTHEGFQYKGVIHFLAVRHRKDAY